MKVLVACEFSGTVRDAFIAKGYDAISCDLIDTEVPGPHIKGDVLKVLSNGWDLMIAHPPCTHLAVSGARWFKYKREEQREAIEFARILYYAPIPHICIENPVSVLSGEIGWPAQTIQPFQFGHQEMKRTCLWLVNLPKLIPTNVLPNLRIRRTWRNVGPGEDRSKIRSRFYKGIAEAMADQWGDYISSNV